MIVVLMGVTGTGKTTVGRLLAKALDAEFAEGDSYHPPANVEKMRSGIPLDDDDRRPWLETLSAEIGRWLAEGRTVVLACSALRQAYRDLLAAGRPGVRFVHLKGEEALLRSRLEERRGHYMPPSLLASQLATLEPPTDAITIDVSAPPEAIVGQIRAALARVERGSRPQS
jgi:gluconokinase